MNFSDIAIYVVSLAFLAGGFFIFIPLWALLDRRPLVLPVRLVIFASWFLFLPILAIPFAINLSDEPPDGVDWSVFALVALLLAFAWRMSRGCYSVIGASESYLREALLESAASLEFTVEETMTRMRLLRAADQIQVRVNWIGVAGIRARGRGPAMMAKKFADEVGRYFKTHLGKMDLKAPCFLLTMGLLLIGLTVLVLALVEKMRVLMEFG